MCLKNFLLVLCTLYEVSMQKVILALCTLYNFYLVVIFSAIAVTTISCKAW